MFRIAAIAILLTACTGEISSPLDNDVVDLEADASPPIGDPSIDAGPGDPPAVDAAPDDPAAFCGDGTCDPGESCSLCAGDCGSCPAGCGDGICNGGEDCQSCPGDCGACGAVCGDGVCNGQGTETCTACAADCNTADPVCGNGECQAGETPTSCRIDCGPADWPLAWAQWEQEVVDLLNQHRAAGTDCPNRSNDATGPLSMNAQLQAAARLHSWDMSAGGYFAHDSCNGRSPWQRAAAHGTSATGETIGGGYPSPAAMVDGWMNSSGHCNILMGADKTLIGVGYANEAGGKWTALVR